MSGSRPSSANGRFARPWVLLVTAYDVTYVVCAPVFGPISDRGVGKKKVMCLGALVLGLGTASRASATASVSRALNRNSLLSYF